jgi:DNA-binding transcriptional MerR regulator/quercetin dioxygenase-like cupin family protein
MRRRRGRGAVVKPFRFRIAEAARVAGVSTSTLRLWEAQGLVEPHRTASGQRLYAEEQLERLREIARLRRDKGYNPSAIAERLPPDVGDTTPSTAGVRPPGDEARSIGSQIRRLRHAARRTLDDVAKATGIPISVLSTFERTSSGLSLASLHELARYFGTTIASLSGQEDFDESESLIRRGQWPVWPPTSPGVVIQALARGKTAMECHRFELAPGASSEGTYRHEGEEFIHVLSGAIELTLDTDRFFVLSEGDSFYFSSQRRHRWRNLADGQTVVIWINTPPSF